MEHFSNYSGNLLLHRQQHRAQDPQIGPAAQGQKQGVPPPEQTRSRLKGNGYQARRRNAPEEQVQQDARRSPPPPMPAEAQQVIYRPGDRPQQQTDPQPPELEGNFDLHRSAQQPGEKAALFPGRFVGDGVDAPLHL